MEMAQKLNKLDLGIQVWGVYSILSIIVPKNEKVKPNQNQNNKKQNLQPSTLQGGGRPKWLPRGTRLEITIFTVLFLRQGLPI